MRYSALLAALALLGCIPRQDNPADPTNVIRPTFHALRYAPFSCRQWFGFVAGYESLHESASISDIERQDLDVFCDARCTSTDPGGPDVFVYDDNPCQNSHLIAGASLLESPGVVTCDDGAGVFPPQAFREQPFLRAEPAAMDLLVWSEAGAGRDVPVVASAIDESADGLRIVVLSTSADPGYPNSMITSAISAQIPGGVLVTRRLDRVDRLFLDSTFRSQYQSKSTTCSLRTEFEQAYDVFANPLGLSGGYGAHVAIADLDLDKGTLNGGSALELATSFAVTSQDCFVDILYRDSSTRYVHYGFDGHPQIRAACGVSGPPAISGGPFLAGGVEAFAIPSWDPVSGVHSVHLWGATATPDTMESSVEVAYVDTSGSFGPAALAWVGNLIGDARGDFALITADQKHLRICSSDTAVGCLEPPIPDCGGAPVDKVVAIAEQPYGIGVTQMLTTVQSANGTCLLWWDRATPLPVVARTDTWTTHPEDASAFWTTRGGAPRAIMLGLVDTAAALTLVREIDPNGGSPDVDYSVIGPSTVCADALPGTGTGIGAAGAGLPIVDCDDTGCTVFSYRVVGVPRFDMPGEYIPQLHVTGTLLGAGAIAFLGNGCSTDGEYFVAPFPFSDALPSGVGASFAARVDVGRARHVTTDPASVCEAAPTYIVGAPGAPAGGVGSITVLYTESGDGNVENPACAPSWP